MFPTIDTNLLPNSKEHMYGDWHGSGTNTLKLKVVSYLTSRGHTTWGKGLTITKQYTHKYIFFVIIPSLIASLQNALIVQIQIAPDSRAWFNSFQALCGQYPVAVTWTVNTMLCMSFHILVPCHVFGVFPCLDVKSDMTSEFIKWGQSRPLLFGSKFGIKLWETSNIIF